MYSKRSNRPMLSGGAGAKSSAASILGSGLALVLLALPLPAHAFGYSLKLEPGFAVPVSSPQTDNFSSLGGTASLKALFDLGPYVDIGPTAMFVSLASQNGASSTDSGTGWGLGGGLRLKRPHDQGVKLSAVSPWLDSDMFYVRTGPLDRFAFAFATGLSFPVDQARRLWLGPFVRYLQVVQSDRPGFDNTDAKIIMVGLTFEAGSAHPPAVMLPPPVREAQAAVQCPCSAPCPCPGVAVATVAPVLPTARPDRDNDGLPDDIDVCPDVPGSVEDRGCPPYQKVIVRRDKIELKEHIMFAWDKDIIESASYPLLDEVVRVLNDNKSFKVRVEGHTDSSGPDAHNHWLSNRRALAVLDYLVNHGVAKDRVHSSGLSSSEPLETNKTVAGREANRRVEFMVELVILSDGSIK